MLAIHMLFCLVWLQDNNNITYENTSTVGNQFQVLMF